jgi:PEP-CTERM motif
MSTVFREEPMKNRILSLLTLTVLTLTLAVSAQASLVSYTIQSNGTITHVFRNGNASRLPAIYDALATDGVNNTGGTTLPKLTADLKGGDVFEVKFLAPAGKKFTISPVPGWTDRNKIDVYIGQPYTISGATSSLGTPSSLQWYNLEGTAPTFNSYEAFYYGATPTESRLLLNSTEMLSSGISFTGFKLSYTVPSGFSASYTDSAWVSSFMQFSNRRSTEGSVTDPGVRVTLSDAPAPVPEPSTYALFSLGLGGMALLRRRKNA